MRIAYLVSRYPAVSHTFIQREVLALRRRGLLIDTFSIRRSQPHEVLSTADREEFETTSALLPARVTTVFAAQLAALVTSPWRYASTLWLALRLSPGGLRSTLWQLFYFVEAILLWRACRTRGIRHIHAHFANVGSDVALLAAYLGGAGSAGGGWSWSFTMHGGPAFCDVRQLRLSQKVERASFVVCISDFCRSQLMVLVGQTQWSKLQVARCGVDVRAFRPFAAGTPDRREKGRRALRVLCVGRLTPAKGQAVLLEALAELVRRGVPVQATLVGEGPTKPWLEELAQRLGIAPLVEFAGAVGQDEISSHYAAADVFCLPSFIEGLPVVLMEAMAMGLPVVTTRITGTPELVEDGVSGRLVSPARADQLADALTELAFASRERADSMGRAAREKVCAEFDLVRSAERLHEVFETGVPGDAAALPAQGSRAHALTVTRV